jgi:fructose-bisphosphate aldolase class 1
LPGLQNVAAAFVAPGEGILAADESIATMSRRLEAVGAAPTAEMRRGYRQLLLITQGLAAWISGTINAQAAADDTAPWRQTFSFGRALVEDALRTWRGVADNTEDAQRKLTDNCQRASQASAAGSPDCAQPLSNERQAGRA